MAASRRLTRRCWTKTDALAAAAEFLSRPRPRRMAARELVEGMCSDDAYTRRASADVARTVAVREPGALRHYADLLVDLAMECPLEQWQARGYSTLAAAYTARNRAQRMKLADLLRGMLEEEQIAIRAIAIEAFATIACAEPELRDEAIGMLELCGESGIPAIRSRGRRMMLTMMKSQSG